MDNQHSPDYNPQDDTLADFTDQVFSTPPDHPLPPFNPDPELARLEQTVVRLKKAFGTPSSPPETASHRIRQNLMREWGQAPVSRGSPLLPKKSWWAELQSLFGWSTHRRRQHTLALAFSLVAIAALVITLWLKPGAGMTAASVRTPGLVLVIICAAVVVFLWDRIRRR